MANLDKSTLLSAIAPPLDPILTEQLLTEFISLERRYVLGDWGPATLDGGQFTEAAARLLYHQDSRNLNRRRSVSQCLDYVEDPDNNNSHYITDWRSARHICKVLRSVYKFRSDRGAVHIDVDYSANHIDSKLVLENSRWVLAEFLRLFWRNDLKEVATAIRQLVQFEIPVIGEYEGRLIVQRTDCTTEEEILILLHHAGENGLSRKEIGSYVQKDQSTITKGLRILSSNKRREVLKLPNGNFRLTDIGIRRVLENLGDKLTN
jgi:hypothetical protein